jgi:AAA15 family ATPase/GTPase
MIIKFRFSNFLSFRDEQELSLVAGSTRKDTQVAIPSDAAPHGLLRCAAIYGANASGKSNIFKALEYFVGAIRHSHRNWEPEGDTGITPFKLSKSSGNASLFELDFVVESVPYQYGFTLDSKTILREWLNSFPNGRKQLWFTRDADQNEIKFGPHLTGENRAIEKLTRSNSLFLSAAAQNNHPLLSSLFSWLTKSVKILFESGLSLNDEVIKKFSDQTRLSKILKHADLGIIGLNFETVPNDERTTLMLEAIAEKINELFPPKKGGIPFKPPKETVKVFLSHSADDGSAIRFDNANESAGTLAFLSLLIPALEAIDSGGVLCVDELEESLHPLLALEIVRLFNNAELNTKGAQLIFNTHDVNLLDSGLLRRDQVWFTEKAEGGDSHLYALTDFHPRVNENLKRGYLQGRYGAVPYLGSFSFEPEDGSGDEPK